MAQTAAEASTEEHTSLEFIWVFKGTKLWSQADLAEMMYQNHQTTFTTHFYFPFGLTDHISVLYYVAKYI